MKTHIQLIVIATAAGLSVSMLHAADDINAILNQIQGEGAGKKNTTIEKTTTSDTPTATPKKKKSTVTPQKKPVEAPVAKVPAGPKITIWAPNDKLPKDFRGQGVAGMFAIYGTTPDGWLILVPAEEYGNPFARQFTVVGLDPGLGLNRLILRDKHVVQVDPRKPLIFIGKGVLPGIYNMKLYGSNVQ